jgi:peptide/nickel transport system permease protein
VRRYVVARLGQAVLTLLVVITVVFGLARLSGNPAEIMAPPEASAADIKVQEHVLGLDRPILVQFGSYLRDLVVGDFGTSFSFRRPVLDLIAAALPRTLLLGMTAFLFAAIGGIGLGTLSAFHFGRPIDSAAMTIGLLGQSVPAFWLGIVLVFVFSVQVRWLPAFGSGDGSYLILPAIALGFYPLAAFTRLTRSAVLETLNRDHIVFLRAKGVHPMRLLLHTWRSASLPVVTLSGIQLGALISTAIVVETLFAWGGVGQLAIQAIRARDYVLVQGIVIVNTLIYIVLLFLVDLSYGFLDVRLKVRR